MQTFSINVDEEKLMLVKYSVSTKTVFEIDASFLKLKYPFNSQKGINQRKKDYTYSFES